MRLNEFTTDYISTEANTATLPEHIKQMLLVGIGDDGVPFLIGPKRRPQDDRAKLSDER